jgi:hypothetical protein
VRKRRTGIDPRLLSIGRSLLDLLDMQQLNLLLLGDVGESADVTRRKTDFVRRSNL